MNYALAQVFIVSEQSFLLLCNMTSKWCRDKGVVVAVYAEKPPEQGGRHHHHHHHYHKNVSRVRGYNRRAELLDYARHLRAPAQSHPSSHIKQLPTTQVLAADGIRKQKHSTSPTCFDKWSFVVTRFLRSITALKTTKDKEKRNHKNNVSTTAKMKALVQKKGIFFSELLTALRKRR